MNKAAKSALPPGSEEAVEHGLAPALRKLAVALEAP